ncbi:hypothetical protein VOLCADRAFT_119177 [Volvox carteri f. nagariensis]|uniref:Uncharacterized protein n=1 Tax=Volvox carteri f. nagariensis TaxID=3068 RepID=D8UAT0_VOLCA|nr:uncharacterized protein VOLCADRAFT_119177 [Volvox carteri f. nagariensis]EFJ43211.1 hypothetical protein VOLCADRAFT_119177 [Volvox carteri f. nagariensis]|eukprot:XP_002955786.1 hypothetical protein VOLCADRAFT_119177 [Volvox carteri f. nagariensis]
MRRPQPAAQRSALESRERGLDTYVRKIRGRAKFDRELKRLEYHAQNVKPIGEPRKKGLTFSRARSAGGVLSVDREAMQAAYGESCTDPVEVLRGRVEVPEMLKMQLEELHARIAKLSEMHAL